MLLFSAFESAHAAIHRRWNWCPQRSVSPPTGKPPKQMGQTRAEPRVATATEAAAIISAHDEFDDCTGGECQFTELGASQRGAASGCVFLRLPLLLPVLLPVLLLLLLLQP